MVARLLVFSIAAASALLSAACDKVPLLAPTGATITLTADTGIVAPGGATQVTAFVVESAGTPVHDGTLVRFSATLGTMNPVEVETRGGLATATFTAGNASGTAQIRATSGAATGGSGDTATNMVEVLIGGAAAVGVSVSASPSRVPSTGGTVTLIASAMDASGNRLVGTPITFSTTNGTLSATVAATDANGEARVTLTTNREATVTARAGSQSATTTVTVGTAPTVTLSSPTPESPRSGSPMSITVTPAAGTTPRVTINWGDGRSDDLGVISGARSIPHTYQSSGTYTITATSSADGETFTTSTSVTVGSGAGVTLSAPDPASPTVDSPVTFTVTPVNGTPRVVINWGDGSTEDLGILNGARTVVHTYSQAGSYVVTATATVGSDSFTTSRAVTVQPRAALNVTVTANDSTPEKCVPVGFTATPADAASYRWTIDSTTDSEDAEITTTGNTLTRVFSSEGTKTISVAATTTDGRTGNGQTQIVVEPSANTCS